MKKPPALILFRYVLVLLLAAQVCPCECAVTAKGSLARAEGVRWAITLFDEASRGKPNIPPISAEIASRSLAVDDGYVIEPDSSGRGVRLRANSEGAIIYGLLDLRDRVRHGQPIPRKLRFAPTLRLRGLAENFPFWAGTTMYSNFWQMCEKQENDPKSWWWDKPGWTRRFREYAEQRINCLQFAHPHPFPALLVYDRFPEAQVYSPDRARKNADMFRWIVAEGKKYGVSIYFLTWNITVPPSFAKAHGVDEFGSQAQVVKDYTRWAVRKLFETYPGLGGLVTMGAETPVGCTNWVIENVVSAMNQCKPKPNLIWWGWCTYPEDSLRVKQAYKGRTEVLHYLQYEQFFKPIADPRIGRWSRETGGTKMIAIGGPKSALGFYTWGDPDWAREIVRSLKQDNNGSGLMLETYITNAWLARAAFCRYMWEMEEPNRENAKGRKREREQIARDRLRVTEWERRAGERYSPSVARDFLDCYRAASRIIPRFLCLVHSQSDHFQPQVGIPLVYYLGMPSLSTYVFEWHDGIDSRGRLKPNYGLTWPNPNWGEKVLPIMDYASNVARGKTKFTSTTPVRIADEIEFSALLALGILDQLDKQKPANNAAEFAQTLKLLRMNAYWGLYTAWKIRAAVNWALFKAVAKGGLYGDTAEQRAEECVKCLERSVQWYRKLTDIASQVYPNPARFYLSFLVSPPPWKQNDVWFSYQPVTTHWREMLPRWERELEIVREQLKLGPERAFLPLSDQLWQEPEGRVVASFDFEYDDPSLILDPATACTAAPGQAISGTRSLFLDTRGLPGEWHEGFKTDPSRVKLEPGKRYQVRVKYRVIANPGKFAQPFAVAGRSDKGGFERDVGESRSWSAPAGAYGERVIRLEPRDFTDYHVFLTVRGPAAIAIDDLTIAETPRPTARGGRFPASPTE